MAEEFGGNASGSDSEGGVEGDTSRTISPFNTPAFNKRSRNEQQSRDLSGALRTQQEEEEQTPEDLPLKRRARSPQRSSGEGTQGTGAAGGGRRRRRETSIRRVDTSSGSEDETPAIDQESAFDEEDSEVIQFENHRRYLLAVEKRSLDIGDWLHDYPWAKDGSSPPPRLNYIPPPLPLLVVDMHIDERLLTPQVGSLESSVALHFLLFLDLFAALDNNEEAQDAKLQERLTAYRQVYDLLFEGEKEPLPDVLMEAVWTLEKILEKGRPEDSRGKIIQKRISKGEPLKKGDVVEANLDEQLGQLCLELFPQKKFKLVCTNNKCRKKDSMDWETAIRTSLLAMFGVHDQEINLQETHIGKIRVPCKSCQSHDLHFRAPGPPFFLVNVIRPFWSGKKFEHYPLIYPEVAFLPTVDMNTRKIIWYPYRVVIVARHSRLVQLGLSTEEMKNQLLSAHWMLDVRLETQEQSARWYKYSNVRTRTRSMLNPDGLPALNLGWRDPEPVSGEVTLAYIACDPPAGSSFQGFEERVTIFDPPLGCLHK